MHHEGRARRAARDEKLMSFHPTTTLLPFRGDRDSQVTLVVLVGAAVATSTSLVVGLLFVLGLAA
jgi:hypothetical protein